MNIRPPKDLQAAFPKGVEVDCVVRKVEAFGALVRMVDVPSVLGLIRPREWSWSRRGLDLDGCSPGDRIRAQVIGYRERRLELSRRLTLPNPYLDFKKWHKVGDLVQGKVTLVTHKEAGVLLSLGSGVQGYVPRAEIPDFAAGLEGFGLLAQDQVLARVIEFREDEVHLSVKEHLRLRDRAEAGGAEERSSLRYHPTVGTVLEDLSLTLQLQDLPDPEIPRLVRERVRRILIVEDNGNVSESLKMDFEQLGFSCDVARSPEVARLYLRTGLHELVILDINLPEEKGIHLLPEIPPEAEPAVFILTAASSRDWTQTIAERSGAVTRFFQKPTSALQLLEHLARLLGHESNLPDDRGQPAGFSNGEFVRDDLAEWSLRDARRDRRSRSEEILRDLKQEANATQAFVLSYRSGPLFRLVAGEFVELTREVQQELDASPIGDVIKERAYVWVPDVSTRSRQFQHLLRIHSIGSFVGCPLAYADQADYGLFLLGEQPNQLRIVAEERLRIVAAQIGNLIAEEKLNSVVTENQGLMLTGFLSDSLLHEIKNAVQAVDGFSTVQSRLAKRHATDLGAMSPEEVVEFKKATLGIQTVADQLKDLVILFRNLAGRTLVEEVDLAASLQRLLATIKPLADEKSAFVEDLQTDSVVPTLRLNPKLLDQALLNLMINALEQMERAGVPHRALRVSVRFRPDRPYPILISVTDTGPGIHSVQRDRIFDLFFSTKERGTGLGLYVARAFVEQLGGRLRLAESYLFSGSTFVVELPREVIA